MLSFVQEIPNLDCIEMYICIMFIDQSLNNHYNCCILWKRCFLIISNFCRCTFKVYMHSNMPGWTLLMDIETFRQNCLSYCDISMPLLDVWKQCKLMVRTKAGDFVCRSSCCGCMTLSFCKVAVLILLFFTAP